MTTRHIQMKITTIGMEKGIERRYPGPKWSRIACIRVVSEIVDDGPSQVGDVGQDQNERKAEKPCQGVSQKMCDHDEDDEFDDDVLLFCPHKKIDA